jgi:adenosylcobinamide kinase / adenosylcobinamide-phosphate guanylyltransferase
MRTEGARLEPTSLLIDGLPLTEYETHKVDGGHDITTPGGGRILLAGGPGERPEPRESGAYDAVLLDLIGAPDHLGRLRRDGTVTDRTFVAAVHVDHRISSPAELDRRLRWWTRPTSSGRTLILGGSRSGKSEEAELRVAADPEVTYVATARTDGADPEWQARIKAHRDRRPTWWHTIETIDLAEVLHTATGTVLIDGIGTWLTAQIDAHDAWDEPHRIAARTDELIDAWRGARAHVVAVSDEVGLSVVPATTAGRAFRDALGRLNQRLAAESEQTTLVVAGRVLELA